MKPRHAVGAVLGLLLSVLIAGTALAEEPAVEADDVGATETLLGVDASSATDLGVTIDNQNKEQTATTVDGETSLDAVVDIDEGNESHESTLDTSADIDADVDVDLDRDHEQSGSVVDADANVDAEVDVSLAHEKQEATVDADVDTRTETRVDVEQEDSGSTVDADADLVAEATVEFGQEDSGSTVDASIDIASDLEVDLDGHQEHDAALAADVQLDADADVDLGHKTHEPTIDAAGRLDADAEVDLGHKTHESTVVADGQLVADAGVDLGLEKHVTTIDVSADVGADATVDIGHEASDQIIHADGRVGANAVVDHGHERLAPAADATLDLNGNVELGLDREHKQPGPIEVGSVDMGSAVAVDLGLESSTKPHLRGGVNLDSGLEADLGNIKRVKSVPVVGVDAHLGTGLTFNLGDEDRAPVADAGVNPGADLTAGSIPEEPGSTIGTNLDVGSNAAAHLGHKKHESRLVTDLALDADLQVEASHTPFTRLKQSNDALQSNVNLDADVITALDYPQRFGAALDAALDLNANLATDRRHRKSRHRKTSRSRSDASGDLDANLLVDISSQKPGGQTVADEVDFDAGVLVGSASREFSPTVDAAADVRSDIASDGADDGGSENGIANDGTPNGPGNGFSGYPGNGPGGSGSVKEVDTDRRPPHLAVVPPSVDTRADDDRDSDMPRTARMDDATLGEVLDNPVTLPLTALSAASEDVPGVLPATGGPESFPAEASRLPMIVAILGALSLIAGFVLRRRQLRHDVS